LQPDGRTVVEAASSAVIAQLRERVASEAGIPAIQVEGDEAYRRRIDELTPAP